MPVESSSSQIPTSSEESSSSESPSSSSEFSSSSEESSSSADTSSTSSEPSSSSASQEPSSSSSPSSETPSSSSSEEPSSSSSEESSSSVPTTYTIDFDLDGGTSSSYDGPIAVSSLGEAFFFDVSKENYSFRGWLYKGVWIIDENGIYQKSVILQDGMVFKAKFEAITYPITYVLDGGTNSDANPSSLTYSDTVVLEDATKKGYLFGGWYLDNDFSTSIDTLLGSEVKELGGITLYAKFTYNSLDSFNYPYLTFTKLSGNKASVKYSKTPFSGEKLVIPDAITLSGVDCYVSCIETDGFSGLSSFAGIDLPAHLESIGNRAFEGCSSLASVRFLSDEALDIGTNAFSSCSSLQFVKIGTCVSSIGSNAFKNCHENLVFLYESGYDDSLGDSWNPDHRPCVPFAQGLGYIIEGGVKYMKISASYVDAYCAFGATKASISIPEDINGIPVLMIAQNAFYQSDLTSCSLPSNMMIISAYAFAYCSSLPSIYIPDSVDTILDYAFLGASSLKIYCQASSAPIGWSSLWNPSARPVYWNQ